MIGWGMAHLAHPAKPALPVISIYSENLHWSRQMLKQLWISILARWVFNMLATAMYNKSQIDVRLSVNIVWVLIW